MAQRILTPSGKTVQSYEEWKKNGSASSGSSGTGVQIVTPSGKTVQSYEEWKSQQSSMDSFSSGSRLHRNTDSGSNSSNLQATWLKKYQGKGYDSLASSLLDMEDGEEKDWLTSYADRVKKSEWNALVATKPSDWIQNSDYGLKAYQQDRETASYDRQLQSWINQMAEAPLRDANPQYYQMVQQYRNDTSYKEMNDRWSEEQRRDFGYLYAQDKKKAEEYAIAVNEQLNAQAKNQQRQAVQEKATSGVVSGLKETGKAIGAGMLGIGEYMSDMAEYAARGRITEKGDQLSPVEYSNAVTGGIAQHLNDQYGTIDEDVFILGGKGLGDVYSLGTSVAQSMASAHLLGGTGTLISFFGSAAASGIDDAKNRGATDEQAIALGTLQGIAEGLAEKIGVDNLFKRGASNTIRGFLKNVFAQAGSEGIEEGLTSLFNNISENIVMGENSLFYDRVNGYVENGMEESAAKKQAWLDCVEDILFDSIAGAASGGISGSIETGIQNAVYKANTQQEESDGDPEGDKDSLITEPADTEEKKATELQTSEKSTVVDAENATTTAGAATGKNPLQVSQSAKVESIVKENADKDESSTVRVGVSKMETVQMTEDIESFSAQFGQQAETVKRNYLEGQQKHEPENLQEYEVGFQTAFAIGLEGGKAEALTSVPYLSQSQREIAFSLGRDAAAAQKAAEAKATSEKTAATSKPSLGQSAQLVTEDGGSTVTIAEITAIDENGMTFRLEDGRTVTDEDLDFPEGAEVYSTVMELGMDAESANAIVRASAAASLPRAAVAASIETAYHHGQYGYGMDALLKTQEAAGIPESILQASYQAGEKRRQQRRETAQTEENRAASKATAPERRGKVHFHGESDTLNDVQKESLRGLEWIADLTGAQIHVEDMGDSEGLSRVNGLYDPADDSIHIDLRAGSDGTGTLLYTAAHEFVHRMRQNNEAAFYRLADFLVEQYGKKGISTDALVKQQMADAAEDGIELNYDEAFEEMVADAMEAMFTDTDALTKMEKLKTQDKSLWQEIKDFVLGLVEKIKAAYARLKPDSAEARYVLQMKDSIDQFAQLFAEGVMGEGIANNDSTNTKVKYSFAGRGSATADRSALQQAEELAQQGVDNETIRQQTGWYKGMDGQWRYEIDDSQMEISENISNYMRLGDLMQHEKLYAAYPDLADIDVAFQSLDAGVNGSYHPQFDSINLSYRLKNDPIGLKDTLVHEIQHAIQHREGFTKGATAEGWERKKKAGFDSRRAADVRKAQETERELRRIQEEEPEFYRDMVELDAMTPDLPRGEIDWETLEKIKDDPVEWQQYDARREELEAKYGDTKVWDMNDLLYQREQAAKNVGRSGVELYFDTAGEIEARDASNRRSKTPEQRKSSPPRLGNEDTVFAEGNAPADDYIPGDVAESELENGINEVAVMSPISAISGTEFTTEGRTLLDDVDRFFKSVGGQVYNSRLGDINLTRRGVKDSLAHGMTPQKAAAFAAIPDVLRNGKVVGFEKNWKHRGYDSATIAAPITIGGEEYLMAVVVHRSNSANRFYVHDVFTAKKEATPFMTGTQNLGEPGGATSTISIIRRILDVKRNADKKTDASVTSESRNDSTDRQLASDIEPSSPQDSQNSGRNGVPNSSIISISNSETEVNQKFSRRKQSEMETLQEQNKQLEEDVARLKELVKLQGKVTHGKIMKPSSVEDAAKYLKKLFHTKSDSDTKELTGLLQGFYEYIAGDPELTWEGVREQAAPIVEWLQDNEQFRRDQYAQDILDSLKGQNFHLDKTQLGEVKSQYGNMASYRKAVKNMASSKSALSLAQLWQELSSQYPDIFPPDTSASDMPLMFADALERLDGMESTEFAMDWRMKDQAMLEAVYDSYWRVSGLETVADKYSKKIFEIRGKHYEKMTELRKDRDQKLKELQESKKQSVKTVRDNRDKAAEKKKILKTIAKLNKLLIHGNKKKHVKKGMEDFAATALASAEILFTDNISNEDMILNGIGTQVDARENRLIEEVRVLLQKRKDLYNLDTATQETEDIVFTGESESYEQRMAESEKLDRKISEKMRQLKGVFERERNRLNEATVSGILEDLAEAYRGLGSSDALYIRAATDERVYQYLKQLKDTIGGTTVRDMSVAQLKAVSDAYTIVLTTIRNANTAFTDGRSIQSEAEQMVAEFRSRKIPEKALGIVAKKIMDSIGWNYEKFHYALDRIGSPALTKLFDKLADSENVTMRDIQEAKAFQKEMVEKYHYNDWKIDQKIDHIFLDNTGKEFRLTLGELMALYAYSRRDGADRHIEYGGFKLGKAALTDPKPATTYKLTAEQLAKITGMLTDEQRAFAEAMQKYLSETMGAKGNEVSMKLYGIEMFKEENYFPLHIAGEFKAQAQESQAKAAAGFQTMSNAGFTQARNKESTAPIVLEDFMSAWADHVNEMSRYHGAVPALEDIRRVMNYSVYSDADGESVSVEAAMTNAFGKQAVQYFDNLYREANSGAIADKLDAAPKKMLSLFRKNAVAYSVSVWIQQPASIYRARMMVDRKYFGRHGFFTLTGGMLRILNRKKWNAAYEEMMRYAPGVTMAKEIGGFDTSTGSSIRSYLMDTEKSFAQSMKNDTAKNKAKSVLNLVDDNAIANLPNVMDKVAWIEMWEACKRETVAKNPKMETDSDAFLEKVGQRFTEVIRGTQVYDSMFAKSPMLKTNNLFVQSAVSFMNEPNTVANMAEAAIRDLARGNKKQASKTAAALVTSIVVNELLKSIVYAMRDDDEDETLLEKYISAVAGSLIDDVTVFNYIPFVRDVWSVWQGYDAERADMAIVSDAVNAVKNLTQLSGEDAASMTEDELVKWNEEVTDASWAVAETLSPLFGIPLKNIRRDILAVFNAVKIRGLDKDRQSTALSIRHTVEEVIWQGSKSGTDRLYEAMAAGDAAYVQRLRDNYKSDSAWQTAVRKGLRDHDSRIWEAAAAWNAGDMETYIRIAKEIRGENRFAQDDIVLAIRAEANSMVEKEGSSAGTVKGYFTNEKFGVAMGQNNVSMADTIRKDLIDTAVANGKTREEAEESVRSTARSQLKQLYANDTITGANAEKMLVKYGGYDQKDAADKVAEWKYEKDYPELDGRITYTQYKRWETDGKTRGISLDTFTDVAEYRDSGTSGSVRSQDDVKRYIETITGDKQTRHALWCCFYKESTSPYK